MILKTILRVVPKAAALFVVVAFLAPATLNAQVDNVVRNNRQAECRERGLIWSEDEQECKENPGKNNTTGPTAPTIDSEEREKLTNCDGRTNPEACLRDNPIVEWTVFITNILAVGVGVIVTIMIIIGGIQYASAGPNPQAIQSAKKKIANAILALIAYMFLYAFVQYLVPGGIF